MAILQLEGLARDTLLGSSMLKQHGRESRTTKTLSYGIHGIRVQAVSHYMLVAEERGRAAVLHLIHPTNAAGVMIEVEAKKQHPSDCTIDLSTAKAKLFKPGLPMSKA